MNNQLPANGLMMTTGMTLYSPPPLWQVLSGNKRLIKECVMNANIFQAHAFLSMNVGETLLSVSTLSLKASDPGTVWIASNSLWDMMEILHYEGVVEARDQGFPGRCRAIELARADLKGSLRKVQKDKPVPDANWILAGPMSAWAFQELVKAAQMTEKHHGRRTVDSSNLEQ